MSYSSPFRTNEPTYTAHAVFTGNRSFDVTYRGDADVQTEQQRDDEFQDILDFVATYPGFSSASSSKQYGESQTVTPTP